MTRAAPFVAHEATPDTLRTFLERHHMTVVQFATHCGVSRKTVYNWLSGVTPMRPWVGVIMGWLEYVHAITEEEPKPEEVTP